MDSLQSFIEQCNSLDKTTFKDDASRREALAAARALCGRLETPMDTVLRICWVEPTTALVTRLALDKDLFSKLDTNDGSAKTSSQLAESSGMDRMLADRILRHLAAVNFIKEVGPETYGRTTLSDALIKEEVNGAFDFLFDVTLPGYAVLPEYLKMTGYKNPDGLPGPWQYVIKQDSSIFDWYSQHPKKLQGFQNHMTGYTADRPGWLDIYPAGDLLHTDSPLSKTDVLLVDIAGGYGQDLERFRVRFPEAPGRLILQERPEVLEKALANDKIEHMIYDMFTPQPIKGARAYFLHSILHGGDDNRARSILNALRPAMKRGYSKLLINENVIPASGAHPLATSLDLIMMVSQSSMERREDHWREIIESTGFRVIKVHTSAAVESLIEAELA